MNQIQLLPFQTKASDQIAERYDELASDPRRPTEHREWATPFYQGLSAITGAGKTAILADTIFQLRALMPVEPIVLWVSKAKAVVDQTLTNLSGGGKYAHLIEGFIVHRLANLQPDSIRDGTTPIIAMTTVGAFNVKDKETGNRRLHQSDDDRIGGLSWTALTERRTADGRRPLIVVYDEGHNLSDQQTDLLLELEPDVILVASATMKTPGRLGLMIDRLRRHGWNDDKLATVVRSKDVVEAGLVKRQIVIGGYVTLMESAIDDVIAGMAVATTKAQGFNAGFTPKAIYVCKTNISQDDGSMDNPSRPFRERKAPPILIWRYLVERKGVDPKSIAVYCQLKFDRKTSPPPDSFVHFSGGDEDFTAFSLGNYQHVIFNQSLQEGWDDPSCCFAYIDKSMGARVSVEQVIGRVLRQPGAQHYSDSDLNTANFFIRMDGKQEFPKILKTVRARIGAELPEISIEGYSDRKDRTRVRLEPRQVMTVPAIHIDSTEAIDYDNRGRPFGPLADAIADVEDYTNDQTNTVGKGELVRATQVVGDGSAAAVETLEVQHSNRVMARWIVRREVNALFPDAVPSVDWSNHKFDARVEITSLAARKLRESAGEIVDAFLKNSRLTFENDNPYTVGPVFVDPADLTKFKHALHEGYSGLNEQLEAPFAEALDDLGLPWARNPANGGFSIPLLDLGGSRRFFPDFLVWKGNVIYALDPKGKHLIGTDAGRKLLTISDEKSKQRVLVRLFTQGKWDGPHEKKSDVGYTVWSIRDGKPHPRHFQTVDKAVAAAVK